MMVVTNSSNYNRKFTDIEKKLNISVLTVKNITGLVPIFQKLFGFEMAE